MSENGDGEYKERKVPINIADPNDLLNMLLEYPPRYLANICKCIITGQWGNVVKLLMELAGNLANLAGRLGDHYLDEDEWDKIAEMINNRHGLPIAAMRIPHTIDDIPGLENG